jgi:hypothetical protein
MLVDFRPHARLRGNSPVDFTAAVIPVLDALREDTADLDRVRVVCDWVQYKENFRDVVDVRPVLSSPQPPAGGDQVLYPAGLDRDELEIAVDVRRSAGVPLQELTAERAEVQVAYAIGVARPVSLLIDTFGTERVGRDLIQKLVTEHFDLRPAAFRSYLDLHRPIYSPTSAYGHFGRTDVDLPWERTDRAAALREAAGLSADAVPATATI